MRKQETLEERFEREQDELRGIGYTVYKDCHGDAMEFAFWPTLEVAIEQAKLIDQNFNFLDDVWITKGIEGKKGEKIVWPEEKVKMI